jgi:hypothetical protein
MFAHGTDMPNLFSLAPTVFLGEPVQALLKREGVHVYASPFLL